MKNRRDSPSSRGIAAIEEKTSPLINADLTDQAIAEIEEPVLPLIDTDDTDQKGAGAEEKTALLINGRDGGLRRKRRVLRDRPVYGAPAANAGALGHIPMTEAGVLVAFGMIAAKLGLVVLRVQTEFPDCEVLCEMEPGRWQRLRVEFEFESRNFLRHGHDPNGCDMIVCWTHNWAECPENIEVVELRKMFKKQMAIGN